MKRERDSRHRVEYEAASSPEALQVHDILALIDARPEPEAVGKALSDQWTELPTEQIVTGEILVLLQSLLEDERIPERDLSDIIEECIESIDERISDQMAEVIRHPEFKSFEASWRSLWYLIEQIPAGQNSILLSIVNVSKEDLLEDFEAHKELEQSGFWFHIFNREYDTFGGKPYAVAIGNYEFGHSQQDIQLLRYCGQVASAALCPFLSSISSEFLEFDRQDICDIDDIESFFEFPRYAAWNSFRKSEAARFVSLCLLRFLLRPPYGPEPSELKTESFSFDEGFCGEKEEHEDYLWGNSAFMIASNIVRSFIKYGWFNNIVGPNAGGMAKKIPLHYYESAGMRVPKCPTEVSLSEDRELDWSRQGFASPVHRLNSGQVAFFDLPTLRKPAVVPKDPDATNSDRLTTKLYHVLLCCRFSHYLKVMMREELGTATNERVLQEQLEGWIKQYVGEDMNLPYELRAERPLRGAKIVVKEHEDKGWYNVDLALRPWYKMEGLEADIVLTAKI